MQEPAQLVETKLLVHSGQRQYRVPATLRFDRGRIWFDKSPLLLKGEIKAMRGAKWHGRDEDNPQQIWSVEDCGRNRFQLEYLAGKQVFEWFDRPLVKCRYRQPLMAHQQDLADSGVTYHYQIWAAEMGVGKTLAAQSVIEHRETGIWFWVGPKTSLPNIEREFKKWNFDAKISHGWNTDETLISNPCSIRVSSVANNSGPPHVVLLTYDALVKIVAEWKPEWQVPLGVIFDESSRLKNFETKRSRAAYQLAEMIRRHHGHDGYVILMSGTPSPKSPLDWWSQCEICWPGFLREGSTKSLEARLAFMSELQLDVGLVKKRSGWRDNERKCDKCGDLAADHEMDSDDCESHEFKPSKNEVGFMYERLRGLVQIKHKKDCLTLPDKRYRVVKCDPSPSMLRVSDAIVKTASSTMLGLTLLRELSDGFQYREEQDGFSPCNHCPDQCGKVYEWFTTDGEFVTVGEFLVATADLASRVERRESVCPKCNGTGKAPRMIRITKEVPCPKDGALKQLLEECEETGRVVIFAGFTGSVDRINRLCRGENWDVVQCDGRGFDVQVASGRMPDIKPLDYWADLENNPRVAFVAHPESGGMSFTLTEARMAIFWSNSFKPEYRIQAEDRIHRKGMDENLGCEIVDLVHLPSDERVLRVIRENRRLELMTLGELGIAA
jgi:SNF2 family DNA or RNA helicase